MLFKHSFLILNLVDEQQQQQISEPLLFTDATNLISEEITIMSTADEAEETTIVVDLPPSLLPTRPMTISEVEEDDTNDYAYSEFPKSFALRSYANGKYLSVLPTLGNRLAFNADYIHDYELFEAIDATTIGQTPSAYRTVIGLRSIASGKFVSAVDTECLSTIKDQIEEYESFVVYYGNGRNIALKAKNDDQYVTVTAYYLNQQKNASDEHETILSLSSGFLDRTKIFEVIQTNPDEELDTRKNVDKMSISLKSVSNKRFITATNDSNEPVKALAEYNLANEMFEVISVPGSEMPLGQNGTLVGLRSTATKKFLSLNLDEESLFTNSSSLTELEMFEVYYSSNNYSNVIGLKAKANERFVCAYPNMKRALAVDRKYFREWEMFEIIYKLNINRFPMRFALRSYSSSKFIQITNGTNEKIFANRDQPESQYELFEPYFVDDPTRSSSSENSNANGTIIGIRSLATKNFLTVRLNDDAKLYSDAAEFQLTEMFEIYFLQGNMIGLKSRAKNKYLCAYPSQSRALVIDRDQLDEWEMFEVIPY